MNISGLIKNFLGDAQVSEPKTLELKTGEVVKGMVMQKLSDQEAILNIGGVQVRAKLETPLKQGEVTLLQVQPESASGQVVLKPLDSSAIQITDGSLGEILKNVGLPDTVGNRQLIQALHQAGVSLNKETVQAFAQLQGHMPAGMSQEDWLPSAIIAHQKGIPLTPDTVQAVRQAVAGPAFHETLQKLDTQLTQLLADRPDLSAATKAAIEGFKQVMNSVKEMSAQLLPLSMDSEGQPSGSVKGQVLEGKEAAASTLTNMTTNGKSGIASSAPSAAPGIQPSAESANELVQGARLNHSEEQTGQQVNRLGSNAAPPAQTQPAASALQQPMQPQSQTSASAIPSNAQEAPEALPKTAGSGQPVSANDISTGPSINKEQMFASNRNEPMSALPHESGRTETAAARLQATETANSAGNPSGASPQTKEAVENAAMRRSAEGEGMTPDAPKGNQPAEHWIPKLIKALGVDHENQLFKLPDMKGSEGMHRLEGSSVLPQQGTAAAGLNHEQQKMADSLKSVLLQLSQSQDIPPAMKESVQQAVQQITGQQLMLNSDRSSMFTHVTLFVPILNANGEQTAAVHIQSRKGKRGEIDAQNCRLLFDLRMKALGDTLVDVKVVDKIVSLQVMNDQPFVQGLLDSYREEIASSLSGIGYQFISLKCSPYPVKGSSEEQASTSAKAQDGALSGRLLDLYGNKQYKGMDVKV